MPDRDDCADFDTILPDDVEQAIQQHREFCRALFRRELIGMVDLYGKPDSTRTSGECP